jgi:hypothetical protein
LSNESKQGERENPDSGRPRADAEGEHLWRDESGIMVFGGGGRVFGSGLLDLDTDQRGAERWLNRAPEPDPLVVRGLAP